MFLLKSVMSNTSPPRCYNSHPLLSICLSSFITERFLSFPPSREGRFMVHPFQASQHPLPDYKPPPAQLQTADSIFLSVRCVFLICFSRNQIMFIHTHTLNIFIHTETYFKQRTNKTLSLSGQEKTDSR